MNLTEHEFKELQKKIARNQRRKGKYPEIGGFRAESDKHPAEIRNGIVEPKSGLAADALETLAHKSKYNARETWVDGIRFDSRKEAARWNQLVMLERAGVIMGLRRQVPYVLIDKSAHGRAIRYIADFAYMQDGKEIVEDVKGVKTPVYKLKRRMMAERYGIIIKEV